MVRKHPDSSIIRDAAVQTQTGKTWSEWFAILDSRPMIDNGQTAAAAYLHEVYRISPWWAQAVAIRYLDNRN